MTSNNRTVRPQYSPIGGLGRNAPRATLARFRLDTHSLPPITDTLPVAEAFRHALMRQFQRHCHRQKYGHANTPYRELFRSEVLAGKGAEGQFLRQHRHAFYLPTAEDAEPHRITHVTVLAAAGFGADEIAALNALRAFRDHGDGPELRVQLIGLGDRSDRRVPFLDATAVWVSATPFLATRYPKLRGTKRDRPEDYATPQAFTRHVLSEELARHRDLPPVLWIDEEHGIGPTRLRPMQFQRCRSKRGDDGGRRPVAGFRLKFASEVAGPLCLGHACHFGLGLFVPAFPPSDAARERR
jgi:CRISPR-associated protein Csb2